MKEDNEYFWNFTTKKEATYEMLNYSMDTLPYDIRLGPPLIMNDYGKVTYQPQDHKKGKVGLYVKEPLMKGKFPSLEEALDWAAKHHNVNKEDLELKM